MARINRVANHQTGRPQPMEHRATAPLGWRKAKLPTSPSAAAPNHADGQRSYCLLWESASPPDPHRLAVGGDHIRHSYSRSTVTGASPENPSARAAAGVTSMMRPLTKGPRSLTVTTTDRPLLRLVTRTFDPNGRDRCAAVSAPGFNLTPL